MPENNYPIGYRHPPRHTRFKKGQSGNPKGRPKKSILSAMEIFDEELERKITIKEANGTHKITFEQAIIRRLLNKAVAGDMQAIKFVLQMYGSFERAKEFITSPPVMVINPPAGAPPPEPPIHGGEDNT